MYQAMFDKYGVLYRERLEERQKNWIVIDNRGNEFEEGIGVPPSISRYSAKAEQHDSIPLIVRRYPSRIEELSDWHVGFVYGGDTEDGSTDFYPTISFRTTKSQGGNWAKIEGQFDTGSQHSWADAEHYYKFDVCERPLWYDAEDLPDGRTVVYEETDKTAVFSHPSGEYEGSVSIRFVGNWKESRILSTTSFGERPILIGRNILSDNEIRVVLDAKNRQTLVEI